MGFLGNLFSGNTLYYPGCLIKAVLPKINDAYRTLLKAGGVEFIELNDRELCCGSPVANTGFTKDAKKIAKKNLQVFTDHSIGKLITPCPACAYTFKEEYKNWLGDEWNVKVEHITETLYQALENGQLRFKKVFDKMTYHDPCYLTRYQNIIKEPRALISQTTKELVEMSLIGKETLCCGAGAGVKAVQPDQAKITGSSRVDLAKKTKAEILTSSCPMCYVHLKECAGKEIKVLDLSQVLLKGMNNE